ncbi:SMP-30/Gluconolaconase/LRE-like region family [Verrucomicrobiia bacterium DG1235]|nr:SMP-30/Gluconolaconase/LRE-like region family [Verrucomicrobiae bacterium DG1235]
MPKLSALIPTLTLLICCAAQHLTIAHANDSFYTERLDDSQAIYLTPENFPVVGDGVADDTAALQMAINAVQEKSEYGILFVPEGRYRLTKTLHVWKGIRLIGFGKNRPTFLIGENTPGFQHGEERYLIQFTSNRPREDRPIRDANPGTFYSAISNIDIEIADGNPAAIGVRSHYAQHCYLAHMDFRIGSGKAGVEKVGNEIEDCRFFGGDYGILTTKPSPSWPFVMVDSHFEGQRVAAIRTEEAGLTLLRIHIQDTPTAIMVNPDRAEELYLADSILENISGPALVISDEYNARPQFNLQNVFAKNVPILASFRKSGKTIPAPSEVYRVKDFTHGLQIDSLNSKPKIATSHDIQPLDTLPSATPTDIPALPPQREWVNIKDLGAHGDGETDDTEALRAAIASYKTIYLPLGRYRVSEPIELQPDTVLIGLHPLNTQIFIRDYTPAFMGEAEIPELDLERLKRWGIDTSNKAALARFLPPVPAVSGPPIPLLTAPKNGTNILTGIGLNTGGANPSALALKWMAGPNSLVNDVRFHGGHGTYNADGTNVPTYNDNRTADGNLERRWDSQYTSLWVTDGGGGTFKDIWTPSPYAASGMRISNTSTEGRVYQVSSEHHVRAEVQLQGVSNWKFYAMQFEEESGEGPNALPIEIENSSNILFANTYLYRVDRMISPYPYGIKTRNSHDLDFRGIHVYSPTKYSYDNTLYDETSGAEIRSREIARLHVSSEPSQLQEPDPRIEKIADGFQFIDAATSDSRGNVYFSDSRWHRIYKWSATEDRLSLVSDTPIAPVALACDQDDNLIILTASKKVFSLDPNTQDSLIVALKGDAAKSRPDQTALLPGHRWRDAHDLFEASTTTPSLHYPALDGRTYVTGLETLRRGFTLRPAVPGHPYYLADEFGQKVWKYSVNNDGSLHSPKLFAEEGELDLAVDSAGNVFIAAGQIHVFDPDGKKLETIRVPERPATLVFGGPDKKDLYITARSSLYRIRLSDDQ